MPKESSDLHGNAPDKSCVVLLMIDVINDLEFPEGDQILKPALAMAQSLADLKARARAARVPVVYVNDNFGRWRSDFRSQVDHCLNDGVRGEPLVRLLKPDEDDYFVLKPKHSGFFSTSLDILLEYLGAQTLIMTGLAGNLCVLYTANDAYMRDYRLIVPPDCTASNTPEDNEQAIEMMKRTLKAEITPSAEIELEKVLGTEH